MLKLAVFDLDHTLLHTDKTIDAATVHAIEKLRKDGLKVAVSTGRTYELAVPYARQIGADGLISSNNGALIRDYVSGHTLRESFIDEKDQLAVLDYALTHEINYVVYTASGIYSTLDDRREIYETWNKENPDSIVSFHRTDDIDEFKHKDSYKILLVIPDESFLQETTRRLSKLRNIHVTKSSETFLDVVPKAVNKGVALEYILDYYGAAPLETIVFGDSDNDAEMLRAIPFSFAMKNGTIRAKQAARFTTPLDNDRSGVADVLANLENYRKKVNTMEKQVTITDEAGMHARPASKLVQFASKYDADIKMSYKGKDVDMKSVMGVMSLGIPEGGEITIKTSSEDAEKIIEEITDKMEELGLTG